MRDLVLTTDTGTEAATKRAEFIWKSLGPNRPTSQGPEEALATLYAPAVRGLSL